MIRRYAGSILVAAAITFGLFFLMQSLIALGLGGPGDEIESHVVDIVRLKRESETELKRRLPKKLEAKEQPPPPAMKMAKAPKPRMQELDVAGAVFDPSLALAGGPELGAAPSDTDIIPLVRVPPQYPHRAQSRGIEGWVQLEFTITKVGTVKDVIVVAADPPSVFDRAAIRAIMKWKYKPKIEDGVPVERRGVQTVITFELEDD